jgi:hypothetical protein
MLSNVYVARTAFDEMPDKIFVAVSEDPIEAPKGAAKK